MVPKVFCFFVLPWRLLFHVFASKNRWVGFLPCFHPVNQVLKKWFRFDICSFFYLRYCPVFPPVFFTVIKKKTEILRQKRVISMNNLQQGKNKMEKPLIYMMVHFTNTSLINLRLPLMLSFFCLNLLFCFFFETEKKNKLENCFERNTTRRQKN